MDAPAQVSHFHAIGSTVYAQQHGARKPADKLSARAGEYKLIGFQGAHIFRLWDPTSDQVLVSSDVIFPPRPSSSPVQKEQQTSSSHESPITYDDTDAGFDINAPGVVALCPAKSFATITTPPDPSKSPRSYREAMSGPRAEDWRKAMERKLAEADRRNT